MVSFYSPDIQTSIWGQPLLRQISSYSSKIRLLLDILQQVSQPHKATEDAGPFTRIGP